MPCFDPIAAQNDRLAHITAQVTTQLLCEVCQTLEQEQHNLLRNNKPLLNWWIKHKRIDNLRHINDNLGPFKTRTKLEQELSLAFSYGGLDSFLTKYPSSGYSKTSIL